MTPGSRVLLALAECYEGSAAGKTGNGSRDIGVNFESLLKKADCSEGDSREIAERTLRELNGRLLTLEFAHKRDQSNIYKVRFSPAHEFAFYSHIQRTSPTERRRSLADLFRTAAKAANVPEQWKNGWEKFCCEMATAAACGNSIYPFSRESSDENEELLTLLPELLAWKGESLIRFASCQLCNDSKRLELLAPMEREGVFQGRLRGKLGTLLDRITGGTIVSLEDLGIVANPRSVLLHGPIRLTLDDQQIDLGLLRGAFRVSLQDIQRATEITCTARRCLTVENETTFHELAKLQSGELLIQTSYPGAATVALMQKLPGHLEFWHFGDSDDAGFEILRVLQGKTGRAIQPLHMSKGKVRFEQESMLFPRPEWPFYPEQQ